MPYVPTKITPNLEVLGEVQEFNFPDSQNRGRVDLRTELVPTQDVPTEVGITLKDSAFNGFVWNYGSNFDPTQNALGLYQVANNVRATAPILWVDSNGKVTFNSEAFAQAPTLDSHIATKKYVDDNSGGGGGDVTKAYVDTQDAATLQDAIDYTDSHVPNVTEVKTETMTYVMENPQSDLFQLLVKGGLDTGGWEKLGYLEFDYATHATRLKMTPGVGLGPQTYLEISSGSINAQLKTIEAVASSTNPQGVLNKADVETKISDGDSAALVTANGYTDSAVSPKADKTYVDTQDTAILTQAKTYADSKSSPLVLENNIGVLSALGLQLKNNASSSYFSVWLNGNGYGFDILVGQTAVSTWSVKFNYKLTEYLVLDAANGVNTVQAKQPIVMASTYTPTAAKYVATKDYTDLGAIPIGGILDVPSAATLPSNFLNANASSFNAGTYPTLYSLLGSSVTPNATARVSGFKCIIRAS